MQHKHQLLPASDINPITHSFRIGDIEGRTVQPTPASIYRRNNKPNHFEAILGTECPIKKFSTELIESVPTLIVGRQERQKVPINLECIHDVPKCGWDIENMLKCAGIHHRIVLTV